MKTKNIFVAIFLLMMLFFISACNTKDTSSQSPDNNFIVIEDDGSIDNTPDESTEGTTDKTSEINSAAGSTVTYSNADYGLSFDYPLSWEIEEDYMGTVAVMLAELESDDDLFRENVNVIVQDISLQPVTLEDYTDISLDQLKSIITDYNPISSKDTLLSGMPAKEIIYTGKQGQYNLKWKQVYAVDGDHAYLVTYTAESSKFYDFLNDADIVFDSFKVD